MVEQLQGEIVTLVVSALGALIAIGIALVKKKLGVEDVVKANQTEQLVTTIVREEVNAIEQSMKGASGEQKKQAAEISIRSRLAGFGKALGKGAVGVLMQSVGNRIEAHVGDMNQVKNALRGD